MNRLVLMVLRNITKVPGAWTKLCRYAKNREAYPEAEIYGHIQYILQLAVNSCNLDLKVYGKENIPAENGFLLVGNHQGLFDVVAVVANCDNPMGGVYKIEIKDVPFVKQIAAATNSFAMDRDDVRQSLEVMQKVTKELQAGRNYIIFPEGTRSRNGNVMGEFHGGSFRCAVKAKAPIVPFAVIDTHKVLDEKGSAPLTAQLHFLQPIPYEEYKTLKTTEIAAMVKERIQAVIDEYAN